MAKQTVTSVVVFFEDGTKLIVAGQAEYSHHQNWGQVIWAHVDVKQRLEEKENVSAQ